MNSEAGFMQRYMRNTFLNNGFNTLDGNILAMDI